MSHAGRVILILVVAIAILGPGASSRALAQEPKDEPLPAQPSAPPAQAEPQSIPPDPTSETAKANPVDPNENPCKTQSPTVKQAWIDRLQNGVFRGVCGGAVWFDSFFGKKQVYDTSDLYGQMGLGALYKTTGEYDGRSRFDANIPLPNMKLKTSAFVGRDNPDDYISQSNSALAIPATFLRLSDDQSWLAGLGYTPSSRRLNRVTFRLGSRVSTHPYVFGQARYQYDHYLSTTSALRLQETFFYRSSADGFGVTTQLGYDWLKSENLMLRLSSSGSLTQDTSGVKWNAFATLYQDLSLHWGRARGMSYQLLVGGETRRDVPVKEYGFLGVYRQQVYRPWMFADMTLGYTFPRSDINEQRKGAVNLGLVLEILFGNVPNAFRGPLAKSTPAQ